MSRLWKSRNLFNNYCLTIINKHRSTVLQQNVQVVGLSTITDKLNKLNLPEKPKRPLTPYIRFVKEMRTQILSKSPNMKLTDIVKQCAIQWKETPQDIKQKYEVQFKKEMEDYALKALKYELQLTPEQKKSMKQIKDEQKSQREKRKIKQKIKENNRPKKPEGAYILYLRDQVEIQNKSLKDIMVEMKGKWAQLSETDKLKYTKEAEKLRKNYENNLKIWEEKMLKIGNSDIVRTKTMKEIPYLSKNTDTPSIKIKSIKE